MPREIRKRGKKHKKSQHQALPETQEQGQDDHHPNSSSEPSWIVPARNAVEDAHPEAPFGYVDPDIKAYFRTVDEHIQSWQEDGTEPEHEDGGLDPNEGVCFLPNIGFCYLLVAAACHKVKRVFFIAALGEMSGKEKQLATDPDCSVILERMTYSMDDFVLRVLMDRLSGSYALILFHLRSMG